MLKITDADELERELHRLLAYSQSERPSRSRIASELQSLGSRLAANEEPDVGLRQKAFNQAKSIAFDRINDYGPPLQQSAKAYTSALDKWVSEAARYELATQLVDALEAEMAAIQRRVKVMDSAMRIFVDVAADHNRLSHVE